MPSTDGHCLHPWCCRIDLVIKHEGLVCKTRNGVLIPASIQAGRNEAWVVYYGFNTNRFQ